MAFKFGDQVEACSKAEGFLGSYDTVTLDLMDYKNLSEEEDESTTPKAVVSTTESHPVQPKPPVATDVRYPNKVDHVFDNDVWWVGKIAYRQGPMYYNVYFDSKNEESVFDVSRIGSKKKGSLLFKN